MAIRSRSSRKILPGVRVNRNGNSTSYTVGGKYHRTTINTKTGRVTETTRIPGTHVTFTTTSQANTRQRTPSPVMYRICGIVSFVFGSIAAFLGLISFSAGGWGILIFSLPLLYYGWKFIKLAKQNRNEKM